MNALALDTITPTMPFVRHLGSNNTANVRRRRFRRRDTAAMIVLVTDFGDAGPYVGQMEAVLRRRAPAAPLIRLFNDAPVFDPRAAAYLLPAYVDEFPPSTVFLCVVDPGVGTDRAAGALKADRRWYVGPDNGLFELIARRSAAAEWWPADPLPATLSATFHGRDLFAPLAADLASGRLPSGRGLAVDAIRRRDWPDDWARIVYIDYFGNAMTGFRASKVHPRATVRLGDRPLIRCRTFADVSPGDAFCYANANGLLEIAVNRGRADAVLGLRIGTPIAIEEP